MQRRFEIENIEEMRRLQGIDDVELHEEVRGLKVGDLVNLTLLSPTRAFAGETLVVRITSIRGPAFRGKLGRSPSSRSQSGLRLGSLLGFTADHIHSLPKGRPALPD
jgi:hypothetical protein